MCLGIMNMTIEETIQSLKPGDRVRVTFEETIKDAEDTIMWFASDWSIDTNDRYTTITSIEVIEQPLQVGDQVHTINGHQATILAIAEDHAMLKFRDKSIGSSHFKNLKRI